MLKLIFFLYLTKRKNRIFKLFIAIFYFQKIFSLLHRLTYFYFLALALGWSVDLLKLCCFLFSLCKLCCFTNLVIIKRWFEGCLKINNYWFIAMKKKKFLKILFELLLIIFGDLRIYLFKFVSKDNAVVIKFLRN